jgi:hypothetical protein
MHTSLELSGNSLPESKEILTNLQSWLQNLPDKPGFSYETGSWSCHGLTRAAKKHFALTAWQVHDGIFAEKGMEHSWLLFEGRYVQETGLILDVAPWGCLNPFIVSTFWTLLWGRIYKPDADYFSGRLQGFEQDCEQILALC